MKKLKLKILQDFVLNDGRFDSDDLEELLEQKMFAKSGKAEED